MKSAVALVLLFAAAWPVERELRAAAAPTPAANRIGMGRLLGGVLAGPFRPMLLTYLWLRGDILYGQGRHDELQLLYRTMTALYPDNEDAREYLGWHIAFNLKNEAPSPEIAWKWSRDGLDILADLPGAHRTLADWLLKQCGQNPVRSMRYAGEAWEAEKVLRARVRAWGQRRYGAGLERFDLGLLALEGREKFFDQLRRLSLLTFGLYDDCVRLGKSDKFGEAIALALWMSRQLDLEGWKEGYEHLAWLLGELEQRRVSERLLALGRYEVAAALWGLGAHARDERLLRAAKVAMLAYQQATEADCARELALIGAWVRYARAPGGARPPLPFD